MLDKFHDIIGGIHVPVDDGVDKLNRKYTLLVFLFLALPIFTKQYIGDPIECFAPVYFAEHQSRYINSYCWTQSTYYMVPVGDPDDDGDQARFMPPARHFLSRLFNSFVEFVEGAAKLTAQAPRQQRKLKRTQQEPQDRITPDELDYFISFETVTHIGNERLRRVRVSYYQWAPLILLAQGLCFYIPFLIWNSCANNAGVKLRRLLKKASDIASLPPGCQQREALLAEFVDQFHTLVMGEAGWCADLQCGGAAGQAGVPGGALSHSSAGSSASSSSAGSGGPHASGHGHGHAHGHHHHHHQANGASAATRAGTLGRSGGGGGGGNVGVGAGASGPGGASSQPGAGAGGSDDHHRSNSSSHHQHHQQGAGCCLVGIPILGSLISCCLKPCASFGLVGPSKYLCLLYLAVKFAYVFNVGLQFFLLGKFLGRGYLRHGLELINRVLLNGEWWASPRFPLSTLCQVRADMSGGLRSYTCQCVLPINVFNEKIFSVVWFYMAFLLPLNVLSLLFWVYRTFESNRMSYIRLCLWRTRLVELNQIHRTVRRLSQSYLGWDGVFLLRLIEHNHGSIMATLIMSRLWEFYANQIKLQEDANQIALANNAHNTLSNLTTTTQAAIGGTNHHHAPPPPPPPAGQHQQHAQQPQQQYLTNQPHSHAAAAAATNQGAPGNHSHQHPHPHHHHGPPASHHHQMGPGPGAHHGHAHTGHAHPMHGPHGFAAHGPGPHQPLQPTQAANFSSSAAAANGAHPPQPPPPMAPHALTGPHGHHSGQVSQAPGHHPLHAANTAAPAHHVHHVALTAAAAAAAAASSGPHLSGAFTGAHANLLAQLHHQAAASNKQQQQQQQQQQQSNNQQPPGNVAAAVAALAAAAAATNNQPAAAASATGSQPAGSTAPSAAPSSAIHLNAFKQQQQQTQQQQPQQPQQPLAGGASVTSSGQTNGISAPAAAVNSATTSFITAGGASGGPPLPPPPPAHVVAAVAAAGGGGPAAAAGARPTASSAAAATASRPAVSANGTNSSSASGAASAAATNAAPGAREPLPNSVGSFSSKESQHLPETNCRIVQQQHQGPTNQATKMTRERPA